MNKKQENDVERLTRNINWLAESLNRLANIYWTREIELVLIYIYLLDFKSHHCLMFAIIVKCSFIYHSVNTIKYLQKQI